MSIEHQRTEAWDVPFCPLVEQKEIVRRVEELFALADQIEARYAKAKAYIDKLTQSILAKAFRGELVPQIQTTNPLPFCYSELGKSGRKPGPRNARNVCERAAKNLTFAQNRSWPLTNTFFPDAAVH